MRELSIFVDESGDFGEYDYRSPYYIISMAFHEQNVTITDELNKLESALSYLGLENHCVHAGPIIRQEEEYRFMRPEMRTKILKCLIAFFRNINIKCESFYIEKKHIADDVEFRKVVPSDYHLFQVADLVCTLKLTELKMENHTLSKSEKNFFGDERTIKKNYLKPVSHKKLD